MAQNSPKSSKPAKSRTSKVTQVLGQARESLKLLETLEKETLAKAKTFVRNPLQVDRRRKLTNEKILASLKALGVATRSEVEALEQKVDHLTNEIATLHQLLNEAGKKRGSKPASATQSPSAEAFPNT